MLDLLFSIYLTATPVNSATPEFFLPATEQITLSPLPIINESRIQGLSAKSYLAIDTENNTKLLEYHADEELPIASLTKLMTALIIIENHSLDEIVTVEKEATQIEGSKMYLKTGEQMTVENMMKGLLVKSGNDAAIALAKFHSGSVEKFVKEMNARAKALRMKHSSFKNPVGIDAVGHYSTALDLLILTQAFWKHSFFHDLVNKKDIQIFSLTEAPRTFPNTNKLLSDEIQGVKTGTTDAAGECLILFVNHNGKKIFTVVLGSESRFTDSKKFVQAIWKQIQW